MLRVILKLIPVLVLTCVLVVASWEPNNFGLSLGASAIGPFGHTCIGWSGRYCMDAPGITPPPWLQAMASPLATVTMLFIALRLLFALNQHLRNGRKRGVVTGFIGEQRVFYVQRGLAAHRARHKSLI